MLSPIMTTRVAVLEEEVLPARVGGVAGGQPRHGNQDGQEGGNDALQPHGGVSVKPTTGQGAARNRCGH